MQSPAGMLEVPPDPLLWPRTAAVMYLCLLAHPADQRRRSMFYDTLAARYWRGIHHETKRWYGQEWARQQRLRALRGSGPISAGWRLIIERRMPAALAAEALHHGTARSVSHALSDETLGAACRQHGIEIMAAENRARRIWRESLPVLHLAVGLHAPLIAARQSLPESWHPDVLIEHPQWVHIALRTARSVLQDMTKAPIKLTTFYPLDGIEKIAKI